MMTAGVNERDLRSEERARRAIRERRTVGRTGEEDGRKL